MADFPSMPLWTDALLGDTQHLTAAEFGAYMLMLIVAWRTPDCRLPNDEDYLARISRSGNNWARIKKVVMPFWTLDPATGKLYQKRLQREREIVSRKSAKNSESGKLGALKKKESRQANAQATLQRTRSKPEPEPYPDRDSESPTTTQNNPKVPSPSHTGDGPKKWDEGELHEVFLFASSFCTHHTQINQQQLEPWLRLGLEPADLRRAIERCMEWVRKNKMENPRNFQFFKTFFEGELTEKNARLRQAPNVVTPNFGSKQAGAQAGSEPPEATEERALRWLREYCAKDGSIPGSSWDGPNGWITQAHRRKALNLGTINLTWCHMHRVYVEPESWWYQDALDRWKTLNGQGRKPELDIHDYALAHVQAMLQKKSQA